MSSIKGKSHQRLSRLILPAVVIVALLASFCSPMVAPVSVAAGEPTQTAKYLPEDTEFYTTVDLSLGNKLQLQEIENIWLSNPKVAEWLQAFEEEVGIDIEDIKEDILSWLGGEAAMAMRNLSAEMPEFIVLIGTTDKDASYNFIRNKFMPLMLGMTLEEAEAADMLPPTSLEDFPTGPPSEETGWIGEYEGVKVIAVENVSWDSYTIDACWAFSEDWLIFSTSIDLFYETLDLYLEGGSSLADTENFKDALANVPSPWIAMSYLDMTNIKESIPEMIPIDTEEIPVRLIIFWLPDYVAGSASFTDKGIISSLYYPIPEDVEPPVTEPTSLNSASIVPADAWAFLSVQRLKGGWGYITSYMEENWETVAPLLDIDPETVSFEDFMAAIDTELGFSLDEDVFGWMTGECAFAMVPFLSLDEEPFPNFVIMFEVENPVEVETHLSNIITALGGTTSSTTIEEQPATLIHIPGMEPLQPGYLFLNVDGSDYLVIGLTEDALAAAVNAYNNPAQSLKEAENFEGILSMLPGEKIGMAYLDIGRLVDAMVSLMTEEEAAEFEEYAPFIEPMLAMGCSSSYVEEKHAALMTFALLVVTPEWNPWSYDEQGNNNGYIEIDELLHAISDYIGGEITISQLLEIISLYIGGTPKSRKAALM